MDETDFIVIGAGSAGSIVAARLSEDPANRVTLFEAGGSDKHALISMPLTWMPASAMPRFTWGTKSQPEPFMDQRVLDLPRGRLMGGCGSIDGRMYIRGAAADYDAWRDRGLAGWGYDDVLPYFRRNESNWRGASAIHGGDGPISVVPMEPHPTLFPAYAEAARRLGYAAIDDFNGPAPEGFGIPDMMVRRGARHSSVRAYIDPARTRANLHIRSETLVRRVLFEGRTAVGVEYEQGGMVRTLRARREVVLCAGTFHSPHLLMLSGIGPAEDLRAHGITPVADLPGVGANLQDHPIALTFWAASQPVTFERELRADRLAWNILKWMLTGRGSPSQSPLTFQGFLRSGPEQQRPDLQFQASHVHYAARPWFPGIRKGAGHAISATAILLNPESRGRISLASADPRDLPKVALNFLQADGDRVRLRHAIHLVRDLLGTAPLSDYITGEMAPGPGAADNEAIDAWLRASSISGGHPVGTCAMGAGPGSVVDARLKVRGIHGLRVVDCSVMPDIVRGNTAAPAMMIAEKAADMILGRAPPKS
jgi:choline dehydrogenase